MARLRGYTKWLTPGIGVKRWFLLLLAGIALIATGLLFGLFKALDLQSSRVTIPVFGWIELIALMSLGLFLVCLSVFRITHNIVEPYRKHQRGAVVDVVYAHSKRHRGIKVVAIGGGTGLPAVLRGLKPITSNITAVVTVADDGGSSGRLRRDMQVLPPGDLRNNIAALADDESFMTRLFQYRFTSGDLGGHAFGNLFISALAGITGSLESALVETARVLNIQGRVLPATLEDVTLCAWVKTPATRKSTFIRGESKISEAGGVIERLELDPPNVKAYVESVQAILDADVVVIGPGSLYTSILPNLLVRGIRDALRATDAHKIYICNVATQPGETTNYTVAEHVLALEAVIGRGIFQTVLANNVYPPLDGTNNTCYVQPAPTTHDILQRYDVRYVDLVDIERPWRHDASKLASAILSVTESQPSRTTAAITSIIEV